MATDMLAQGHDNERLAAHHFIPANIFYLFLAINNRAVHTHSLMHKTHAAREVEAAFRAMVDAFRLLWLREVKHPGLLV